MGVMVMRQYLSGTMLCGGVSAAAMLLEHAETALFGRSWLEALVLAILLGTAVRTLWQPGLRYRAGINFCAKTLLEIAIVLLGAAVSVQALAAAGPGLLGGIAATVVLGVLGGIGIGRLLGLNRNMAILVACGNAICGNSAIAAVAPVIGAAGAEIAAAIAFTAVLGVVVVLGLPLLAVALHFSLAQAGIFAGLTVYAVPQVLAATAPLGALAVQVGTLVKLVRVMMLGPVVLTLSLLPRRGDGAGDAAAVRLHQVVPWFILGFLALAALRSVVEVPPALLAPSARVSGLLTVIAMAALGLGTDLRAVMRAGPRVTAAVILSLLLLGAVALALIRLLGVA